MEELFETCERCGEEIQLTHGGEVQPDEEVTCSCGAKYLINVGEDEDDLPYLTRSET